MKFIEISLAHVGTKLIIYLNDSEADTAFAKLKDAMENYKPFRNDKAESVTLESSEGPSVIRLDLLQHVGLVAEQDYEEGQLRFNQIWARIKKSTEPAPLT